MAVAAGGIDDAGAGDGVPEVRVRVGAVVLVDLGRGGDRFVIRG